jgi:hypothetical protein
LGVVDRNVINPNANEFTVSFVKTHNSIRSSSGATLLHEPKRGNLRPKRTGELRKTREEDKINNM